MVYGRFGSILFFSLVILLSACNQADTGMAFMFGQPQTAEAVKVEDFFIPLLPFDGIRPIYDPLFVTADIAPYHADELIIGIAIGTEAIAYSISVLRQREMVNDEVAGIPILVTW